MEHLPHIHYINQESSLLEFNRRVLAQAKKEEIPLLERLKFLCISSSNMDEFFEVRLASLFEQLLDPTARTKPDEMQPKHAIDMLLEKAQELVSEQYITLNEVLIPALDKEGIRFIRRANWTATQREWLKEYFTKSLQPVLTPRGIDPSHPFPRIMNKSLHFIASLEGKDAFGRSNALAVVQVPRSLPRVIKLPKEVAGENDLVFLSSILHEFVSSLFPGMTVTGCHQFRVTRNTNLFVDEEEVDDIMTALQGELSGRHFGGAIRLEVSDQCPENMSHYLMEQFDVEENQVFRVNGPVNLHRLNAVPDFIDAPHLCFAPYTQRKLKNIDHDLGPAFKIFTKNKAPKTLFDQVAKQDILLHHPYDSFGPVIDFLQQAANDPSVLVIRMTLYRTGEKSAIIEALKRAAQNGKEVTAVVELRARFDEDNNIIQANILQDAGVNVVYGVVGYKTHAKMILVVRREGNNQLRHYVHMGTGNYHHITSRFYTDFGLFSANQTLGRDVAKIFQQLTSLGDTKNLEAVLQSPFSLHSGMLEKIAREAENARQGRPARIIAKMNGLQEKTVIDALYEASQDGVQIDLIVRGICSLRPGVEGLSENIRVTSIIGRFLEHHRVYYFLNHGDKPELFCSSADWMSRNLLSRVETCFPILNDEFFQKIYTEGLEIYLRDNVGAWLLQPDGSYIQKAKQDDEEEFSAQAWLIEQYS